MIPVKDNIPTDRLPLVTLLLIAADVVLWLLVRDGGVLRLLASAGFLWIFGPTVEDSTSRVRYLAFCLLGAAAAAGLQSAVDPGSALSAAAASGATAAVVGAYAVLYRSARVVGILPVPFAFSLVEVPAWILLALWLPLEALLAGGAGFAAQCGGLAFGLLTIRAFAQRRKLPAPSSPAITAPS